jgi:hypothetical protein
MKAQTPKQVLQAVLWMYENSLDWIQGSFRTYNDLGKIKGACLVSAVFLVEADSEFLFEAGDLLRRDAIIKYGVITWNDEPGRTKEHVISLLKRVIKS